MIIIWSIVFLLVVAYFFYRLTYHKHQRRLIKENKHSIKLKTKTSLYKNSPPVDVIFEQDDLRHYEQTPSPMFNMMDFDLTEEEVLIPEIDNQNVHDSTVQQYIRNGFHNIPDSGTTKDDSSCIGDIKRWYDNVEINVVLNKIQSRNGTISNLNGKSELQVLATVWEQSEGNENMREYLGVQLRDCLENDNVVCPTGIVNRVVSSLNINNPELMPKTRGIIDQEMMQSASVLRDELELDDVYNSSCENEQKVIFKERLLENLDENYINVFSKKQIREYISPWIDHV